MNILVWGVGYRLKKYYHQFAEEDKVVALVDANPSMRHLTWKGILIILPQEINDYIFDKIVVMPYEADGIILQAKQMGISDEQIYTWEDYKTSCLTGKYCVLKRGERQGKKVLILTTELCYDGGSIAATYAMNAMGNADYSVTLASPYINRSLLEELKDSKGEILEVPILPEVNGYKEKEWIDQYDCVIVNILTMIDCVMTISQYRPLVWWIHEAKETYKNLDNHIHEVELNQNVRVYAVSDIARKNFEDHFSGKRVEILTLGIPEMKNEYLKRPIKESKIVFGVIAPIIFNKGQEILLKAVEEVRKKCPDENLEIWLIGNYDKGNSYFSDLEERYTKNSYIKILGTCTRRQLASIYEEIDVVVCPSLEETLSMVIIEAMMFSKVTIVSDSAGISKYIQEGKNGFIFQSGNSVELADRIHYVIQNKTKMEAVGTAARDTYQKHFSLVRFGAKLEAVLGEMIK